MTVSTVTPTSTPEVLTVQPLLTVAQAKAGDLAGQEVAAFVSQVRDRVQIAASMREVSLVDAALGFHAVVVKGKNMTQGDYADALYGKTGKSGDITKGSGKSMGTLLKRLADAAVRLGFEPGTPEWSYLVQKGGNAVVGQALVQPAAKARKAITAQAKAYAVAGDAAQLTAGRTPRPNDGAEATAAADSAESATGSTESAPTVPLNVGNILDALDRFAKDADREGWAAIENRMQAIITREVTVRAAADKAETKPTAKPRKAPAEATA